MTTGKARVFFLFLRIFINMSKDFSDKLSSTKNLGIAMAAYSSASIFGPLIIIGGLGLYLDKKLDTYPWLLAISLFIAFITTNVLLFKKTKALTKMIQIQKDKQKQNNETGN